jgi:hypothetical protein
MKATRRGIIAGALAVPTVAGLASWRWAHGEGSVLLHDPSLEAGRRFAEAGRAAGGRTIALEGDPIRQAQALLRDRPALIAGVSRQADALLFEEAAVEAGYVRVAALTGDSLRCTASECRSGWQALGRLAQSAGPGWAEALASYAAKPDGTLAASLPARGIAKEADPGRAFGWVLAARA